MVEVGIIRVFVLFTRYRMTWGINCYSLNAAINELIAHLRVRQQVAAF